MNARPARQVGKRRIVHASGFEPASIALLERRLQSGLRRFAPLWGATATASEAETAPDERAVTWQVATEGANWATDCEYTALRWDELMSPYVDRPWLARVLSGYGALLAFAFDGTIGRYFKANLRYGLFVIYPFMLLVGFMILAILAGLLAAAFGLPEATVTAPIVAVVVFALLMRILGSYFYLDFALADWAFALDLARGKVAGFDAVVDRFAGIVSAAIRDPDADEVVLSGVSLGAVMMVESLARAYDREPDLGDHAGRAAFLTVGSSLLKIGLHPEAHGLRKSVGRIGSEPTLFWAEYQAKADLINFYKTDPVRDMGLPPTGKPIVQNVRIRDMMGPEEYRRSQRNTLRLHRQFVMPNGQRYFYDFYHICFGPMPLLHRVRLGAKAATAFAADGSYQRQRGAGGREAALAAGQ